MNVGKFIFEIICIIILSICILIVWIYINSRRRDFSKMKTIPIDGGHIKINKNGEIVINRPILYGIITNGCFFPTIIFFILIARILYIIPLGNISNNYLYYALLALFIIFLVTIILGIINLYKSRYKFGNIVINQNSRKVVYISSTRSEIPFSDVEGFRQELFPIIQAKLLRVVIIMKNRENVNIDLLSITNERSIALAKAAYIEGILKSIIGC